MPSNCSEPVDFARRRFREWFPAMAPNADVQLVWHKVRAQSSVALVSINDGRLKQRVFVKQNRLGTPVPRPRLGLTGQFAEKHHYEARSLRAIDEDLLSAAPVNRAHVLEVSGDLLVLSEVPGRPLAGLMRRAPMRSRAAVEAAGAWLRAFHRCRPDGLSTVPMRHDARALSNAFDAYLAFLGEPLARSGLAVRIERALQLMTEHLGDADVCLGLVHGDFAPRNILVDGAGRIGVIDPLGVALHPIYEDLAYFALSLERGPLLPLVGAAARSIATRLEAHLLRGYQLAESSRLLYQGFAVLVALDMWAADIVRPPATSWRARQLSGRVLCSPAMLVDDRLNRFDRVA